MFLALAVILLVFAGFTVLVFRRTPRRPVSPTWLLDRDQLAGFVYVGAIALAVVAAAVVALGVLGDRRGLAEALAVLGLFGYAAYLVAAAVVVYVGRRREPPSSGP